MSSQKKKNNLRLHIEDREQKWKFVEKDNHAGCMYRRHGAEKRQKRKPEFLEDDQSSHGRMIHPGGVIPTLEVNWRDLGAIKDTSVCSDASIHDKEGCTEIAPLISSPKGKGVKYSTLIIDSDEEDVNNKKYDDSFRTWLRSNIKEGIIKARASQHLVNQQILGAVIEPDKQQPDVCMKVPDHSMNKEGSMKMKGERQLAEASTEEKYVCNRNKKQTDDAPDTKIIRKNQCQIRGNEKVAEDTSNEPATQNEMEPGGNTMPASSSTKDKSSSSMLIFQVEGKESSTSNGLEELWKDMYLATEFSKLVDASDESGVMQQDEKCNHSYFLQDDFGFVCRICGIIGKKIDTIFDYQWTKGLRSIRTYANTSQSHTDSSDEIHFSGTKISQEEFNEAEIVIHPRHMKHMKPHQLEGFNFLVKNLVAVAPRGCILAHAPGSGKTFMLISFIQSYLAKYPTKRTLVVLPKGILPIWKKELQRWQVEDIPLHDFYSVKAENRMQQLEVLKNWQEKKSILFLGYQQFSTIIFDKELSSNKAAAACQEILLNVPSLLILDEGHTPRNENTNVLGSLARVQTPCKVVLSGTLFQNHVREVFTILNLVRPRFLRSDSSQAIVKRILSRIQISGRRVSKSPGENAFYDFVEENLRSTDNFKMKVSVIQDLRELTKDVLHYYKGDFLEELPGLVDFVVLLKLSSKQNSLAQGLGSFDRFKRLSLGSAIYMHPQLYDTANKASSDRVSFYSDQKIDSLIESVDIGDGVKAKFFLNILSLAECVGEKVLVFSQYILPLRFLERLLVKNRGWQLGREIFVITGDSISEHREQSMEQFNNSPDAKVFFGSIKACGEGISLIGASRVVILDVHLNPSVTRQAIGRAFRPGQTKNVYVYRLVAADSQEEEDHKTCSNKELISKMWFEWSGYYGRQDFELDQVNISNCQDIFLECPDLVEDIKVLYRRPTIS